MCTAAGQVMAGHMLCACLMQRRLQSSLPVQRAREGLLTASQAPRCAMLGQAHGA